MPEINGSLENEQYTISLSFSEEERKKLKKYRQTIYAVRSAEETIKDIRKKSPGGLEEVRATTINNLSKAMPVEKAVEFVDTLLSDKKAKARF